MIRAEQLTKRYGRLVALDAVDFEVAAGEVLGFLGPNGAGKSTALRILSGYLPPSAGRASVGGHDLATDALAARRATGYLPEHFTAPSDLRVGEYLRFRGALKGLARRDAKRRCEQVAERLGFLDRLRQPFGALSKGFRQRVGLADALLADPPVLLLDEPFSGLDPLQRQEFRGVLSGLATEGKAVLFSSHVLPEVEEMAHRVLVLHRGRACAAGTIDDLQQTLHAETRLRIVFESGAESAAAGDETPVPEQAAARLREAADTLGVELLAVEADALLVRLDRPQARAALFRWLADERLPVAEFRALRPDLEDLFRALVGAGEAA